MLFPDAVQRVAFAERCTADPGSFHPAPPSKQGRHRTPRLERSRVCSAPLRKGYVLRCAREKFTGQDHEVAFIRGREPGQLAGCATILAPARAASQLIEVG